jgi:hypothetical protein
MAGEQEANDISDRIQNFHLVYGFIAETQFVSPTSEDILWTNGNGDGAIWTGSYLAAEAFRYKVTGSRTAWTYLRRALESVRAISHVADSGFLARTIFPLDSPFIDHLIEAEGRLGLFPTNYSGKDSYWVGHPTRDQYSGVFLGLGVTYDLVEDEEVRTICRDTITHLVDALIGHGWIMGSPGHAIQETYLYRPDQLLSVLQLAKHVNPSRFGSTYDTTRFFLSWLAGAPSALEIRDLHGSYYKFNLDYSYFYNLIRLEDDAHYRRRYLKQFARLRRATRTHGNAHFNMIDRALNGPDPARDQETPEILDALFQRGFRSHFVDLNGTYPACGEDRSCDPIPVAERPYADFLWQRSPFQMTGDGDGSIESAGIDYILPYWMARHYGVL